MDHFNEKIILYMIIISLIYMIFRSFNYNKGENFKREVWTRKEAIDYFSKKGELYKIELINDIPETEEITIYKQGKWLDLCKGPHGLSTKDIGEG